MSPVPAIAHLVALALGVFAGVSAIGVLDLPDPGDARGVAPAEQGVEQEAAEQQDEACRSAIRSTQGLSPQMRRELIRQCDSSPQGFDQQALCFAAVRDAVPPGPGRTAAIAACEDLGG